MKSKPNDICVTLTSLAYAARPSHAFPGFTTSLPLRNATPSASFTQATSFTLCVASAKPLRVGIAGAGIAGLTTALALQKTPNTGVQQIQVFETRQSIDVAQGAAVNLNGATAILEGIYGVSLRDVAIPMNYVTAREPSGSTIFQVDVDRMVRQSAMAKKELCVNGEHCFMTVMRDDLQNALLNELGAGVKIHRGESNRVVGVHQQGNQARFALKDGSTSQYFDLIIGADGLRSNVRSYVINKEKQPVYSGIRVQWAVAPGSDLPFGMVEQWFGDGAYVLRYAAGSENKKYEMLACSFREAKKVAENPGYEQNTTLRDDFSLRLERSNMPQVVRGVLERSERLIETGVYRHSLPPKWYRGAACLVGDSGKIYRNVPIISCELLSC